MRRKALKLALGAAIGQCWLALLGMILTAAVVNAAPFAYITSHENNRIAMIDTATNTVVDEVPVGLEPTGVAVSADGTRVYVTSAGDNNVSIIDTATNAARLGCINFRKNLC